MRLNNNEEIFADKLRSFILKNSTEEDLEKSKCKECEGTGLLDAHKNEYGYSWNGEYCNKCKGIGFLKQEQINKEYFYCYKCKGTGKWDRYTCRVCNGAGVVNWIMNILG